MHVVYLLYLGVIQRMAEVKQNMRGTVNKIFSVKTAVTGKTEGNSEREAEEGRRSAEKEVRDQDSLDTNRPLDGVRQPVNGSANP